MKEYRNQSDIHSALLLSDAKPMVDYFEIFFEKFVPYLCQWTNERANKYFEDISCTSIKVYGLKSRPVQTDKTYILLLTGIVKLPGMVDYWLSSIFCRGPKGLNSKIMSCNGLL